MARKGTVKYYADRLDFSLRANLSFFILAVFLFWLYWVFSAHKHGEYTYLLLIWLLAVGIHFYIAYFSDFAIQLSKRHKEKKSS
ncbi:MAG: hypothetical protein ACXQTP_00135 [Candidatus Methanofastidiosia archaeon]